MQLIKFDSAEQEAIVFPQHNYTREQNCLLWYGIGKIQCIDKIKAL